ncbi:LysE family translocator [Marinomonas posidonica]|uniref:Lysine exporter protein (LYSE/YGGA) n=1 Tax=Marinomonas posidonica (strain CECT 7376 / NCIMB 14433 / IVIA-Po-181) TaxID=491952 RepID=F6CUP7_MARPP|nr:LysE family translocator [Marinomonas posidonica]AEF54157.1 Lysine exporter protein (LYSE/YGGA) [Marinomonas posidonica IVIA-Po-181]
MNEPSILLTLALVHFVALISPGPDFALVVQNASRYGRQTGFYIALGLSLGILTHAVLSITGISLLVHQQPTLFRFLQCLGGAYLLYLGGGALISSYQNWQRASNLVQTQNKALLNQKHQAFSKGLLTNLFNPKALVFFISLMSSLIPASMSWTGKGTALLIIGGLSLGWFSALAWLLTKPTSQVLLGRLSRYIDLLCGVLFCLLGTGILYGVLLD